MFVPAFLTVTLLIGQQATGNGGPAITSSVSPLRYRTHAQTLSAVNFDELKVTVDSRAYQLHKGQYQRRFKPVGLDQLRLIDHWLINGANGSPAFAVIHLEHLGVGGSSSLTSYIQILSLGNKSLVLRQEFRFIPLELSGSQVVSFNPTQGLLVVSARSEDDSSDCCPKSVDIASYHWDGFQFKLLEWQAKPYTAPK